MKRSLERDEASHLGVSPNQQHIEFDEKEKKVQLPPKVPSSPPSSTAELPKGSWRLTDLFIDRIWLVYVIVFVLAMAYRFWQLEPMRSPEPILMRPGSKLYPGQWRASTTHHIRLGVDGNLLLSEGLFGGGGRVLWQSRTGQEGGKKCRWCYAKLRKGLRKENPPMRKLEVWNGRKMLADFPLANTFPLEIHIHEA
eukprot:349142_1